MDDNTSHCTRKVDGHARLAELRALDIPPEEHFDRYTRLVSQIFNAPTALISLVDKYRQVSTRVQVVGGH